MVINLGDRICKYKKVIFFNSTSFNGYTITLQEPTYNNDTIHIYCDIPSINKDMKDTLMKEQKLDMENIGKLYGVRWRFIP